ncbi:MAG: hypothetical protein ACI959_001929 [Limisphaerales bacterium]|jgi:hypothetical protein
MGEADSLYKAMARAYLKVVDKQEPNLPHYKGNQLDLLSPLK